MKKTCENPKCGNTFEGNAGKRFCSSPCRTQAWKINQKQNTMNGIQTLADSQAQSGSSMTPGGPGINSQDDRYTQSVVLQLHQANVRIESLEKLIHEYRVTISDLKEEKSKSEYTAELDKRDLIADYKTKIDKLEVEISNLKRDKDAAEKGAGLNGLFNKAIETENGIEQILNGGANLLASLAQFGNQNGQQIGQIPEKVQYSVIVTQIADYLNQGSESEQQKIFQLINALVHKNGTFEPEQQDLVALIDSTINFINNGINASKAASH